MRGKTAVVGVGESRYYRAGQASETEFQLACIAIREAVEDAGLKLSDIDGFTTFARDRNEPVRLASALGTGKLSFCAMGIGGGNAGSSAVLLADAAVSEGYAKYVIAFRSLAQGQFGRFGQARGPSRVPDDGSSYIGPYMVPFGLATPAMRNAIQTKRFMYEYGISQEALAEIALASYAHAQRNPRAVMYGRPLTREAYHASRWIAEPFHLFDCCQETDGAAAVVITTAERARDLRRPPAYIKAAAQGMERGGGIPAFNEPDFPHPRSYRHVGEQLWERAGVGPQDVDVAQFYENFTGLVLLAMSDIGFSPPESIEEFVSNDNLLWPNGTLPINTSGANLAEAYIHGFEIFNEAVRQVRGESTCQVEAVELSLAVSGPGNPPGGAVLFSNEP